MGKRIVFIGTTYPFKGGPAAFNEKLARTFISKGDEFIIHTFRLQYPGFLYPGKTQYDDRKAPEDLNINITINSINPINWIRVGLQIRKLKPDIILMKYWLPFMAPCFGTITRIAKRKSTKAIAIVDNFIPHEKRPGDIIFNWYFKNTMDAYVAMSESVVQEIKHADPLKPVLLCPHPLFDNFGPVLNREEALKKLKLDSHFKYMLFFGIIRDYKGLDLILKAMADERLKALPVKLIVAGEYYIDPAPYNQIIAENNLSDKLVLHTEFIADSDVPNFFSAAEIVVQPYKTATQSGVTQVAYHFNRPMLVTNVGGLSEVIPHNIVGYVVEPVVKDIADSLLDFFINQKFEEFSAGARDYKKHFSWDRLIETVNKAYQSIINQS